MALATQCPHCKTTFKVAHDQLKLRSGLVRCGACKQIFNGIEHLVPPEQPAPAMRPVPPAAAEAPQKSIVADTTLLAAADIAGSKPDATPDVQPSGIDALEFIPVDDPETQTRILSSLSEPDLPALQATTPPAAEAEIDDDPLTRMTLVDFSAVNEDWNEGEAAQQIAPAEGAPAVDDDIWPDTQDSPRDVAALPDDVAVDALPPHSLAPAQPGDEGALNAGAEEPATTAEQGESAAATEPAAAPAFADESADSFSNTMGPGATFAEEDAAEEEVADDEEPGFVRKGRRRQRWGRVTRVFMALASVVLLAAALGQAAYAFRDQLAARFPQTKPALATLCELTGCQVSLPAQIEKIAIESNELQAHANNKNLFTLSLLLHNRSAVAQAWPHVELTLNDKNGMPLVRRALAPRDYLPSDKLIPQGIAARSEQSIAMTFELSQLQASDYRVYLFYP